jgi:malate dehydrogenase (oxaloacetate-decarboxylating)(NADP+)
MATGGDFLNGVGGGVKDHYGEDSATEDQLITPWNFSVARYLYTYIPHFSLHYI